MKKLMGLLFAVTLMVQSQYVIDGQLYVDYVLNGDQYIQVGYDDMFDSLNSALEIEANNKLK